MADFLPALDFLLDDEDAARECKIAPDACPKGCAGPCFAISGVNSGAWPSDYARIAALPQSERLPAVGDFYEANFWDAAKLAGIDSQDLANRVLDEAVWSGPVTAVRLLQRAGNAVRSPSEAPLVEDGLLGPVSLAAVNSAPEADLLVRYRRERLSYLVDLEMYLNAPPDVQAGYRKRALR